MPRDSETALFNQALFCSAEPPCAAAEAAVTAQEELGFNNSDRENRRWSWNMLLLILEGQSDSFCENYSHVENVSPPAFTESDST